VRLKNKTALITGGNSGIGLATAKLFVAEGARVAITGRNQATLEAAAKELGPNAIAIVADATDIAATEKAIAKAVEKFGRLDIVFANAGISASTPVGGTSLETFESVLKTNITAVFFTVQAAAPHLNDGGSVILNGSVISVLGNPGYAAYAASKAGVRAMARVMASELSPRGIRVNVVSPGGTSTPIWNRTAPTPEAVVALEARIAKTSLDGSASRKRWQRPCCSSPPTTRRTFRAPKSSSTAVLPHLLQARRFIADSFCARSNTSPPPLIDGGGRFPISRYAARRLVAACRAPAIAFSRCSGPTPIPSAEMNSGFVTPMKANTQRK
jgi:NAD(P)-dependent dehydrogenase (short-subunit alcohol dehydrogenase family)